MISRRMFILSSGFFVAVVVGFRWCLGSICSICAIYAICAIYHMEDVLLVMLISCILYVSIIGLYLRIVSWYYSNVYSYLLVSNEDNYL